MDLGYERRLASHLGAHRAPSIIGLVKGRVTFFHQAVVREHLRQFIEDLLPTKLVEKVMRHQLCMFSVTFNLDRVLKQIREKSWFGFEFEI